jgi:HK97 family phage major capsid protein
VTGPAGTAAGLSTQGTANQGTDALWNLVGSVAEPYAEAASAAFLMRNATNVGIRKLRDTSGQPVNGLTDRRSLLGYPVYTNPFMPAAGNGAEYIAFGAMDRYFIRIVNGIRFKRSDEFRFQHDLIASAISTLPLYAYRRGERSRCPTCRRCCASRARPWTWWTSSTPRSNPCSCEATPTG